jgi:hypothetical protein
MSERDSVHKEIEKLQEEAGEARRRANAVESKNREKDDEVKCCFYCCRCCYCCKRRLGRQGGEQMQSSQRTGRKMMR